MEDATMKVFWKPVVALAMALALVLAITLGFHSAREAGFSAGMAHVLNDAEIFILDPDESFGNYDGVVYIILDEEHYPHGFYIG